MCHDRNVTYQLKEIKIMNFNFKVSGMKTCHHFAIKKLFFQNIWDSVLMTKFLKEMFLSIQIFPLNQILEEIEYLKHFLKNYSLVFTLSNFYQKALILIHIHPPIYPNWGCSIISLIPANLWYWYHSCYKQVTRFFLKHG